MKFPLVVGDFLDRAEHVYPNRVAVVDEPDQPAPSLGSLTYREVARNARAQAARLDALGVPVGGRVAFVSQNSARLYTSFFGVSAFGRVLVPINFRLSRAEIAYIVEHSGSDVVYVDPEQKAIFDSLDVKHKFLLGEDDDLYLHEVEPQPWADPDEGATATINYTRRGPAGGPRRWSARPRRAVRRGWICPPVLADDRDEPPGSTVSSTSDGASGRGPGR